MVQDDPRDEWFCEYALWRVKDSPPFTMAWEIGAGTAAAEAAAAGGDGEDPSKAAPGQ